jgi:NAD(P)-dependent dehydrogenase (short-subunit alcohol dehydrogenase family)
MAYELTSFGIRVNAIAAEAVETGITEGLDADPDSAVMQGFDKSRQAEWRKLPKTRASRSSSQAMRRASFTGRALYTADGGWLIR